MTVSEFKTKYIGYMVRENGKWVEYQSKPLQNSSLQTIPAITSENANAAADLNVTYVPQAGRDITVVPLKKPISPIVYIGGGLILLKLLKVF